MDFIQIRYKLLVPNLFCSNNVKSLRTFFLNLQIAQPIITDFIWKHLKSSAPESLGPINKFNAEIKEKFGDQGGH